LATTFDPTREAFIGLDRGHLEGDLEHGPGSLFAEYEGLKSALDEVFDMPFLDHAYPIVWSEVDLDEG
jgi:hypothetical protein